MVSVPLTTQIHVCVYASALLLPLLDSETLGGMYEVHSVSVQ